MSGQKKKPPPFFVMEILTRFGCDLMVDLRQRQERELLVTSSISRSYLPSLEDKVAVEEGKAARDLKYLVVNNATQTHSPVHPLKMGVLCYIRRLNRKQEVLLEDPCEVIEGQKIG